MTGIQKIVEQDLSLPLSDSDVTSLSDFWEQLKCKKEILVDLDVKIASLIEEEGELEAEIFELQEIQATISQKSTWITQAMKQYCQEHALAIQITHTVNTETIHSKKLKVKVKRILNQSHHSS